ncbi:Abscisic acid 8'-hydroxylase 2 [Penicillium rolfsii]|nr:Abscisic acid 8'-hydroxylase 2 [Penicillium rolfsii]
MGRSEEASIPKESFLIDANSRSRQSILLQTSIHVAFLPMKRCLALSMEWLIANPTRKLLGIKWLLNVHGGTFFRDMDSVVREFSTRRLDRIMYKLWPIFERGASNLSDAAGPESPIDILPHLESIMAEATLTIFLSEKYNRPAYQESVIKVTKDIAELLGLFQSNKPWLALKLPRIWRMWIWVRIGIFRLPFNLGWKFAKDLWDDVSNKEIPKMDSNNTLTGFLARRYADKNDHLSLTSRLWIMLLTVTVLFGSVHQTVTIMVWVTFYLALHSDSQKSLRHEIDSISDASNKGAEGMIDYTALQTAVIADSFIREVLRMKGDCVNVVRATVQNVELDGYIIPKGFDFPVDIAAANILIKSAGSTIFPVTYLANRSPEFLPDPENFNSTRWVGTGKTAGTVGPGYLAFGSGRWSCPGRFLAVMGMTRSLNDLTEVKCWILALAKSSKFRLEGGKFEVLDAFNVTAVPPKGALLIERHHV